MSVTPVKIGGAGSTTSAQTSIVSALTVGASVGDVVVFIASIGTAKQGTTPTDTKSNTWNLIAQPQSGTAASCNMWYSVISNALTTSDTITTTWTGSVARRSWTVLKCSGLTSTPLDKSGTANAATATSLSLTTTAAISQADELVLAAYGWDETASTTNAVMSADTGYTLLDQELAGGGGTNQIGVGVEWKETAATGVVTASPTMNETCAGLAGVIATFKVASAGPTTFPIAVTVTAPTLTVSVVREGLLNVVASTVSTPVSVLRTGLLNIVTGTVTLPVTVALKLVKVLTITTGTVSLTATVQRLAKLGVVVSTVTIPVALTRKALLGVKSGNVSLTATDQRKGFVGLVTGSVSTSASLARKALLAVKPSVSLPVTLTNGAVHFVTITVSAVSAVASVARKGLLSVVSGTVAAGVAVALVKTVAPIVQVTSWAVQNLWGSAWSSLFHPQQDDSPPDVIDVPPQPDDPLR